jgi:hypothetical protein
MRNLFTKWPLLAWLGLGTAAAIFALGWLITLPVFQEGPLQGRVGDSNLIPLLKGTVAKGEIIAEHPGLSKIRIRVATYLRRNTCRMEAVLFQEGRILAEAELGASWFPDLEWVEIPFYRLGSGLAKGEYQVRFRSPDSGPANAVAISGRAGEGIVMLKPVYQTDSLPAWKWLAARRPDYHLLLLGLTIILACGGLITGAGAYLRRRARERRAGRT